MFIWDIYVAPIDDDFILGLDFLHYHSAKLDLSSGSLTIKELINFRFMRNNEGTDYSVSRVWLNKRVVVPPNSSMTVKAKTLLSPGGEYVITSSNNHKGLMMPSLIVGG